MADELGAALRRLWLKLGGHGPLPRGDRPVDVLLAVVRAASGDLLRVRSSRIDDPCFLETLAFVPDASEHQLDLAIAGAALAPIESVALQEVVLLVDPIPDERGGHRVYAHDVETLPGQPFDWWFPDLADALAFVEGAIDGPVAAWPAAAPEDAWERSARSGRFVLERLLEADLSFWSEWRDPLDDVLAAVCARHPPSSAFADRFRGYLDSLTRARSGTVPAFAERTGGDPTCIGRGIAAHARRWLESR